MRKPYAPRNAASAMLPGAILCAILCAALWAAAPGALGEARAQTPEIMEPSVRKASSGKAFALSLLAPGLGHRHARGGDGGRLGAAFALTDAGLWTGLVGASWRRNHLVESYRTMATRYAGVDPAGKDRTFYLRAATYRSSQEFTDAQYRDLNVEQIAYAADPSFQWRWDTEEHFSRFRELREDAESLRRRRSILIASLAANRLLAGISALRAVGRNNRSGLGISLGAPPAGTDVPLVRMRYAF